MDLDAGGIFRNGTCFNILHGESSKSPPSPVSRKSKRSNRDDDKTTIYIQCHRIDLIIKVVIKVLVIEVKVLVVDVGKVNVQQ